MKTVASRLMKCALFIARTNCTAERMAVAGQRSMPEKGAQTQRSTALTLTINGVSKQLSAADLVAMPQSRVTVHNGHSNRDEVYTGVAVQSLLSADGLPITKENQRTYLRSYRRAQGTDFYFVIYSAAEIAADLNISNVIVALQVDGHDLGREGMFKLVSTADRRPARWVRNLTSLTMVTVN